MKKLSYCFIALLLASAIFTIIKADSYYEYAQCCNDNCYECSIEPLYCDSIGIQLQAGVRPITWRKRGNFQTINCQDSTIIFSTVTGVPKFSKLFKTPWQVGGQASYALSSNTNVFVEFNYAQAKHKDRATNLLLINGFNFGLLGLTKYRLFDAYVGARYYFDRWCNRISLFIGGKIGFIHHKRVRFSSFFAFDVNGCLGATAAQSVDLFGKNTVVAGGGHIGIDYCICGNWSLVLTGEVIASCGPASNNIIALANFDSVILNNASFISLGNIRTELAFPATLGIKYNF